MSVLGGGFSIGRILEEMWMGSPIYREELDKKIGEKIKKLEERIDELEQSR